MKTLIAANWKMYLSYKEEIELIHKLQTTEVDDKKDIVICPSYLSLPELQKQKTSIKYGAQNCASEVDGAHTGEISPQDLVTLGCSYVILGHSERRAELGETDEIIRKKVRAALDQNLVPIICIGESLSEKKEGNSEQVIAKQIDTILRKHTLNSTQRLVIAYEPVWAIYPSKLSVEQEYVEEMTSIIQTHTSLHLGSSVAKSQTQVIYGGSVNSDSISTFINVKGISGALIGHASTNYEEFTKIINHKPTI